MTYTGEILRIIIEVERSRLFASYAEGRSARWTCDQRTKDTVCLSVWLREELERLGIDELGRKVQEGEFYRYARSDEDLFELAASILNNAIVGNIDRERRTHRRWG